LDEAELFAQNAAVRIDIIDGKIGCIHHGQAIDIDRPRGIEQTSDNDFVGLRKSVVQRHTSQCQASRRCAKPMKDLPAS
jgi:hypothetical protein